MSERKPRPNGAFIIAVAMDPIVLQKAEAAAERGFRTLVQQIKMIVAQWAEGEEAPE